MSSVYAKILVIFLLFVGETLSIYAEMLAAKSSSANPSLLLQIFLKTFLVIIVAGGFLIAGYVLGFKVFKNIWVVSVASITSILIMEPILAYTIFNQLPTRGALIGLILGILGFVAAVFF